MNAPQSSETSFPAPRRLLLRFVFGSGVVLFLLAVPSSFPIGGEVSFFTLTGCLLLAGLFVPSWRYRIASVALIALSILNVVDGYQRSIEFQQFLEQQALEHQALRKQALEQQALPHRVDERK